MSEVTCRPQSQKLSIATSSEGFDQAPTSGSVSSLPLVSAPCSVSHVATRADSSTVLFSCFNARTTLGLGLRSQYHCLLEAVFSISQPHPLHNHHHILFSAAECTWLDCIILCLDPWIANWREADVSSAVPMAKGN